MLRVLLFFGNFKANGSNKAKIMKISTPENIDFNSVDTIIFDWGGVITEIDPQATIQAFKKIGHNSFRKYFESKYDDLFFRFEKGRADPEEIYRKMNKEIGHSVSHVLLDNAFCAMLSDTPVSRIEILKRLRSRFQLILLSNTNIIHTTFYIRMLQEKLGVYFPDLFHKVYYSFEIGMRKPDRNIFEYVINESRLNTANTLFIDDTEANIITAVSLGLQSFHLANGHTMETLFHDLFI
jgi:glucose-1-phosphatase